MLSADPRVSTAAQTYRVSAFTPRLLLGLAVFNALVIALASLSLYRAKQTHEQRVANAVENLALTLEQNIASTYDKVDLALQAAGDDYARLSAGGSIDSAAWNAALARQRGRVPFLTGLRAADATGLVMYGLAPGDPQDVSIADRDYFKALREDPKHGLAVSSPRVSRVTGRESIYLARRLNKPDGSFAGAVWATIPLDHFRELFASLKFGPMGSIGLRDGAMRLIVRHPPVEGPAGETGSTTITGPFRAALVAQPEIGRYLSETQSIDGVARLHAYRRSRAYDFYINVGFAVEDYLGDWRKGALETLGLVVLFVLSSILFAWTLIRDAGRRRRAETAMRESEEKYRILVENAGEAVFVVQGDRVAFANAKSEELSGYSREELSRRPFLDFVHPDDRATVSERYARRQQGLESPPRYAIRLVASSGRVFWGELNVVAITWLGRPATLNFLADVTREKKLESQLAQAQKMESVGRLAGGVAHDFNNMLQAILGNAALALQEGNLTADLREHLEEIQKAAQRSANLTRQLLAFARKQTVSPRVLDLNDAVAQTLNMLRRLIGENIQIVWTPGPDLWPVEIDPSQLDQVLANLTVNARDAIPEVGTITIATSNCTLVESEMQAHPDFAPGDYVLLSVADTGCGMDAETLSHLFEPFFTTKGVGEGTGLGLATVYGIVAQNGGCIDVQSQRGRGTALKIFLPRAQTPPPADAAVKEGSVRGTETVLLVEDEEAILKLGRRILEGLGYRVMVAASPGEAIRVAEEYQGEIQLLLTDVVMPEMNGRQLAERLRASRPNLKSLFMSGYSASAMDGEAVSNENLLLVQKPFSMNELAANVRLALGPPGAAGS